MSPRTSAGSTVSAELAGGGADSKFHAPRHTMERRGTRWATREIRAPWNVTPWGRLPLRDPECPKPFFSWPRHTVCDDGAADSAGANTGCGNSVDFVVCGPGVRRVSFKEEIGRLEEWDVRQ
eukprot:gnl/TRDRNA2_/TRDRNA2_92285_c0_seq1.p2 gnl/TRDRNA2_/TRDRNA2_92285_c0~~gnl/TRDRNA2_/TRDRNA2_92285_c0_seq1.p2  ORF type:complete len:122 (-),score=16.62 gnl/TRDRNA2_/TRDRNA2_92285_c0_seq1:99-464(-)